MFERQFNVQQRKCQALLSLQALFSFANVQNQIMCQKKVKAESCLTVVVGQFFLRQRWLAQVPEVFMDFGLKVGHLKHISLGDIHDVVVPWLVEQLNCKNS